MEKLNFDNRMVNELPGEQNSDIYPRHVLGAFWSAVTPRKPSAPQLVAYAPEVGKLLDLATTDILQNSFLKAFSGQRLLKGMSPYASCYGGHQFGRWAGQLGDGRAIGLGELVNSRGERWELQLKGAGLTPYSRHADGMAVLRSSIREFLCSEAVHHLGIPTTRALSIITTGDEVLRDMFYDGNPRLEPGAVVCRVAPSFTRFGNFEIYTLRNEIELTRKLVDFTIDRDFPELATMETATLRQKKWFTEVCERTALLMVAWMRTGFVHGVMNTDNMSILGLTIDYGPYGWIDNFDPEWTPNTTDLPGRRYSFGQQAKIARWNLERLADALLPIIPQDALQAGLNHFDQVYDREFHQMLAKKMGWEKWQESDADIVNQLFSLMTVAQVDMTEFFRKLADITVKNPQIELLGSAFYVEELFIKYRHQFNQWLTRYAQRTVEANGRADDATRKQQMDRVNPRFILRNYIVQQAIERSENGDHQLVQELLHVLQTPYADNPAHTKWYKIRPDWARNQAGCSMLSCSS